MPARYGPLVLGWQSAYLGFASDSCPTLSECVRPPAYNTQVPISQAGNATAFFVSSSDATVATGAINPSAQPALQLRPHRAGSATLTVSGLNGASAQLPIVVTTVSTMTITLNGLPTATQLAFDVSAPATADCMSFEGGYHFQWDVAAPPAATVLQNFPAMGSGPLSACVFSTVTVSAADASDTVLAQKTVQLPIVLGKDNPAEITLP